MIGDFVTLTSQVKVRFEASDLGEGSVVEAGVDDFSLSVYACSYVVNGDADADGQVSLSDVVYVINYLYKSGPAPLCDPVTACGDPNVDGLVDVSDVLYLVNYLYRGGPPPGNP